MLHLGKECSRRGESKCEDPETCKAVQRKGHTPRGLRCSEGSVMEVALGYYLGQVVASLPQFPHVYNGDGSSCCVRFGPQGWLRAQPCHLCHLSLVTSILLTSVPISIK